MHRPENRQRTAFGRAFDEEDNVGVKAIDDGAARVSLEELVLRRRYRLH